MQTKRVKKNKGGKGKVSQKGKKNKKKRNQKSKREPPMSPHKVKAVSKSKRNISILKASPSKQNQEVAESQVPKPKRKARKQKTNPDAEPEAMQPAKPLAVPKVKAKAKAKASPEPKAKAKSLPVPKTRSRKKAAAEDNSTAKQEPVTARQKRPRASKQAAPGEKKTAKKSRKGKQPVNIAELLQRDRKELLLEFASQFPTDMALEDLKQKAKDMLHELTHTALNIYWRRPACGIKIFSPQPEEGGEPKSKDTGYFDLTKLDGCFNHQLTVSLRCAEILVTCLKKRLHARNVSNFQCAPVCQKIHIIC